VGHMVAVNDIVVPVSLAGPECRALESEGPLPRTRFGRGVVLGEGELASVVVPRTEQMHGLDARGCSQRERELNGGHFIVLLETLKF
jgi:hypothetical protein